MQRHELILMSCARRLAKKRKWAWLPGALRGLRRRTPDWAKQDDLGRVYRAQTDLLLRGRLVWGCIIQANKELFQPGKTNWAAETVFAVSKQPDLESLQRLAKALFALRGTQPADPVARAIADHLVAETTRMFGKKVPRDLDPEEQHRISTIMVFRQHLPDGKLGANCFPMLILDAEDQVAMILPSSFWPMGLRREWGLPEPRLTMGLLFGYKLVALFYLCFGLFLGGLVHLTADGKVLEYIREHPVGTVMILLTNAVALFGLRLLKSQTDELPELRPGHLKKMKWYQMGGIPVTERVAFLLWFVAYLIGVILGIVFGM